LNLAIFALLTPLVALVGCGDGGADPECSAFAACGGDPRGDWILQTVCPFEGPDGSCPSSTLTGSGTAGASDLRLAPEMTYQISYEITWSLSLALPSTCFPKGAAICSPRDERQTCTGSANQDCLCESHYSQETKESGQWGSGGNRLSMMSSLGQLVSFDYCVYGLGGNTLSLHARPMTSDSGPLPVLVWRRRVF
jgi:hypothetical protein